MAHDHDLIFRPNFATQRVVVSFDSGGPKAPAGKFGYPVGRNLAGMQRRANACEDDRPLRVEGWNLDRLEDATDSVELGGNLIIECKMFHCGAPRLKR